ncbi:hypothetical protein EBB59_10950 [Lysobacter pythonis]|uniref:Zeta toxin domain-containing protein n=1 Tax=Solilutibacter pythonis TaxID=2483112 RepID=A0A3M2HMJ0_9GAMM|nr:zeta toxin family protein [Lysobacter pythonis]RMH89103.1 hypothetical protein EBB59_10950 [Lysobacter pythonis]
MNTSPDRLDPQTHARIFTENIAPKSGLFEASSQVKPKAIILGGQPGAGKGGLVKAAKTELAFDVVPIDPEVLREYHPDIVTLYPDLSPPVSGPIVPPKTR